jgi:hypothetical protein
MKFGRWTVGAAAGVLVAAGLGISSGQLAVAAPAHQALAGAHAGAGTSHPKTGVPTITVTDGHQLARTVGFGAHQTYDAVAVHGTGFQPNERLYVAECDQPAWPEAKCNYYWTADVTTDANGEFQMGDGGIWPAFMAQTDFESYNIWSDTAPYPDLGPVHCGTVANRCTIVAQLFTLDPPTGPVDSAKAYISAK